MNGIKMQDCRFVVNREKRKITCIYEGTRDFFLEFLNKHMPELWLNGRNVAIIIPNRFVGIATCASGDEWNEEFGKRVAFARLKRSYYKKFFEIANNYVNAIDKELNHFVEALNRYGDHASKSVESDTNYINKHFEEAH